MLNGAGEMVGVLLQLEFDLHHPHRGGGHRLRQRRLRTGKGLIVVAKNRRAGIGHVTRHDGDNLIRGDIREWVSLRLDHAFL